MTDVTINDETKKLLKEFSMRYLQLQRDMKSIKDDIKELKSEYAEQGVATNAIVKALNQIKKQKKLSQTEKFEQETLVDILSNDKDIDNAIIDII